MHFAKQLIKGRFIKRYKRFLVDILLENGEVVTSHCANTGSMKTLLDKNNTVYLSENTNPRAKLDWRLELIDLETSLVGINTSLSNKIVEEAIRNNIISQLTGYKDIHREVKYADNCRIDILLKDLNEPPCYVEVKNCTMSRESGIVEFPDAITKRGSKHLKSLIHMIKGGNRAVMLYLVNRMDCNYFKIAKDIDIEYYNTFIEAINSGVSVYAYDVNITTQEITVNSLVNFLKD